MAASKTIRDQIVALKIAGICNNAIMDQLSVCRKTVYNVWKRYQEENTTDAKPRPGRKRTVRTDEVVEAVKQHMKNPQGSMRKTAKELNISQTTIRRIVKEDLRRKYKKKSQSGSPKEKVVKKKKDKEEPNKINMFEREQYTTTTAFETNTLNWPFPSNSVPHPHPHSHHMLSHLVPPPQPHHYPQQNILHPLDGKDTTHLM